jgi:hypothetical protein
MRLAVKNSKLNLWLFFTLVFAGVAAAQIGNISIENKVDVAKVKIGDLITYSLTVTHDDTVEVQLPGRAFVVLDSAGHILPDDALNISDYQIHEPEKLDGKIAEGVDYVFSPFLVGKFTVASLTVLFKMPRDTAYYRINAEPIQIEVQSMKPSETGDIRDIKPQWEIDRDLWLLWRPILIAVGVILLLITLIIFYKRWRAGKALLPLLEKPKRPVHEIALEALDELVQSDLLAKGEVKLFYSELSDIIRRYIEGCYWVVALEMTTAQLISNLKSVGVSDDIIDLIREFLMVSDVVKFAKYIPGEAENQEEIQRAYEIVNRTKILIEPEPELSAPPTATAPAGNAPEPAQKEVEK